MKKKKKTINITEKMKPVVQLIVNQLLTILVKLFLYKYEINQNMLNNLVVNNMVIFEREHFYFLK